ncbi:hypothetical protein [Nocardiopsis rhodophaea]
MPLRRFYNLVLAMPRESVFWRLVDNEPRAVEGDDAARLLRRI